MIKPSKLPKDYKPYDVLNICSNKVLGGANLVAIGENLPILIGCGETPKVWLQALLSPKSKKFTTVVDATISTHPGVRVLEAGNQIIVKVQDKTVLRLEQSSNNEATVHEIDLRPLGVNVFGDEFKLSAGGMSFSNNTYSGVGVMVAFGKL